MMTDILPDAHTMVFYTVACVILFATPGPDMSLWLSRTLSGGRRGGTAAMLGTQAGCAVHTLCAAAGLSALLAASAAAFTALKIVGALYLLWLAVQALRSGSTFNVRGDAGSPEVSGTVPGFARTFAVGFGINLTNPKVVLFFLTFLPQFVAANDPAAPARMVFLGFYFILINLPLAFLVVLGADRLVSWLRGRPKVLRGIDIAFAGVFGFFAFKILTTQGR